MNNERLYEKQRNIGVYLLEKNIRILKKTFLSNKSCLSSSEITLVDKDEIITEGKTSQKL